MKTIIHSNSPWAGTGYGQQCAQLASLLHEDGHDVAVSAFYGLHGAMLAWNGMNVYPGGFDAYGNDVLAKHATHHFGGDIHGGLLITLVDVWVLQPDIISKLYTACWTPVDHQPAPPRVITMLEASGAWPIAMSRFGERMLTDAGLAPLYAPHGIDTETFKPGDKLQARRNLSIPESAFVVGMVAANKGRPPRKGWPQAIAAFRQFLDHHDDAYLYLHTEPTGAIQGVDLLALLAAHRIPPGRVRFSDSYYSQHVGCPPAFVADIYRSLDVLLSPSYGEGFGIPIVEAQACGVPVIVTDWTAMTELCGAGWLVDGDSVWSDQAAFWKVPQVDSIVRALEDAHTGAHHLAGQAREFALAYDHRRVYQEHWQPVLAEIERRMQPLPLPLSATLPLVVAA